MQAAYNQNCKLVGMDRTGEITENHKRNIINGLRKHSIAWIGAHVESVWMQFAGCYTGIIDRANKGFDLSKTTITSCLSHCGNRGFFLTHDQCFCYQNEVKYVGCSAVNCQHSSDLLCGSRDGYSGMFFPRVSGRQCMCHYDTINSDQTIQGAGDCLLSTYRQNHPSPIYSAAQCNQTHLSICQQPHGGTLPEFVKTESPWYQSLVNCYHRDNHILGTRWLPFRLVTGSYWAGPFSVTNIRWGIINSNGTTSGCIAATETREGKVRLIHLPCNTRIPALCFPSNKTVTANTVKTDIYTTLHVNTIPINLTKQSTLAPTDNLKTLYKSNLDNDGATSTIIIVTIVGSVTSLIIVSLVVVFVFVKRRKVRRQVIVNGSSSGQYMQPDGGEADVTSSQGPGEIAQYINTSGNVYDELTDFRGDRILTGQDMYDHTFTGEMYGHLNAGNYQYVDSDYDHTFSGETDGTYRHLGTTNQETVNSDYDHVFGGVSEKSASLPITNTDDNARPPTLDIQYDDVSQNDSSAVAPVYAQVIKRHLRKQISDSE
ncbi:uncharacterized protein LOC110446823 [Mizuhopecten yessoensis]|uniref:uncharacterized protein LOC110446823 n=1 Tax=Mizuhopecten yessoensis TaxID=6573 RepID=UPI000B45AE39|nr:uncharacterized protein LOC110446823 [Mizuhopecten yessoensis]